MVSVAAEEAGPAWRAFVGLFTAALIGFVALLYAFVLVLDPYGLRTDAQRRPAPLMDLNQRYMYPQLARSGLFDGAILGTSTVRLIDPRRLGEAFGARLANLGMNAATPWEQMQLAGLFLRHVPNPKLVVFGLDRNWCEPDADAPAKRLTFRSFPPWLYEESRLAALPNLLNLRSLEIALRVALNRLGLMRERIRGDGYEVFTPPEDRYDLARAQAHIWAGTPGRVAPQNPPVALPPAEREALRFPPLAWLSDFVTRLPASTKLILLFPPIHVAAQAAPGSREAAIDEACKARIAAIGAGRGAAVVDYRHPSALTATDSNYWDNLHYRLAIAGRIAADLKAAAETGQDAPDGTYRLLRAP